MLSRFLSFFVASVVGFSASSQQVQTPPGVNLPSPEAFVNAVASVIVDTTADHYYLVVGTDSCRFLKYNYEEWAKYYLKEPVTFQSLNELSEKVYLSRYPYFWKQTYLRKALCITRRQADSILAENPTFAHRPTRNVVFSFSLPQFTDDGQFAVIDLNLICGSVCGQGLTCIFRYTASGEWKLVGQYTNWSS